MEPSPSTPGATSTPATRQPGALRIRGRTSASAREGVPLAVPLPFLLAGVCGAAAFGVLLVWVAPDALRAPELPHVLTLVHTATLGWLTMIIMGATFQLAPVILVTPLRAGGLIRIQCAVYLASVVLLLGGFWWMRPWLIVAGGVGIAVAVVYYVFVLGSTLAHATARPLTTRYLIAALAYLCLVIALGLTAALNLAFGLLGVGANRLLLVHISIGVIGWLTTMLMGVSYQLVRMFALTHGHDDRLGRLIFVVLNSGLLALATSFALNWHPLAVAAGTVLVIAIWLFAYDYVRMLRARRRHLLDITQRHGIAAVIYLALTIPGAVALVTFGGARPPLLAALGLAALVGWLGQSTIGYLYKIVPFLIWNTRFGPLVGRQNVPLMRDLLRERWAVASWWLINVGLPIAVIALACAWIWPVRIGSVLLGAGLLLAAANIIGVGLRKRA